jgi:hypothetical protein
MIYQLSIISYLTICIYSKSSGFSTRAQEIFSKDHIHISRINKSFLIITKLFNARRFHLAALRIINTFEEVNFRNEPDGYSGALK